MNTASQKSLDPAIFGDRPDGASIELDGQGKFLGSAIRKRHSLSDRRHKRYAVISIGELSFVNRTITLDGIITEVSLGGLKFRPASVYLMDRSKEQVNITFDRFSLIGRIRATRSDGYGIELLDEFNRESFDAFLRDQQVMADIHLHKQ